MAVGPTKPIKGRSLDVTWPSSVKWIMGCPPTLTTSGVDVLEFYTRDGGLTYRGRITHKDSK